MRLTLISAEVVGAKTGHMDMEKNLLKLSYMFTGKLHTNYRSNDKSYDVEGGQR